MAKSKSKAKKGGSNGSSAKNIKALIAQNKMIENQNAEAALQEEEKQKEKEARKAEKARQEAEKEQIAQVTADEVVEQESKVEQVIAEQKNAETKEKVKNEKSKDAQKSKKKVKEKGKLGKRVKDTAGELKKVSWPDFKSVVKKTGIVFAVVICFALVLWVFDYGLSWLYKLFVS